MTSSASERRAVELERKLAQIHLLVFDVDGTLTDGHVVYQGGEETCVFHVHDGQGIVWLLEAGLVVAWISGRGSDAVVRRARELGVEELQLRVADKASAMSELQRRRNRWAFL